MKMNWNRLLAVVLTAMVCTGLGVASVSGSQLPADVKDGLQVLYLSITDTGDNTTVVTAMISDGEDEHSFVFDPTTDRVGAYNVTNDEDGNVIVTDEDGNVIG